MSDSQTSLYDLGIITSVNIAQLVASESDYYDYYSECCDDCDDDSGECSECSDCIACIG